MIVIENPKDQEGPKDNWTWTPIDGPFTFLYYLRKDIESINQRLSEVDLPFGSNEVNFEPSKRYRPSKALEKGPNHGYLDTYGNEWCKGPSRTNGEDFEWDVQLSKSGHKKFESIYKEKFPHKNYNKVRHLNISQKGIITH